MEQLIELLKSGGGVDRALFVSAVLGWLAREIVALRRSQKDQGKRIGDHGTRISRIEGHLWPEGKLPPAVDGGRP